MKDIMIESIKNKEIRDDIVALDELLNAKKNIKIIFGTDDKDKIKNFSRKTLDGKNISYKEINASILIIDKYEEIYNKLKHKLKLEKL